MSTIELLASPQVLQCVQVVSHTLFLIAMARALPYAVSRAVSQIKIELVVGGTPYESQ